MKCSWIYLLGSFKSKFQEHGFEPVDISQCSIMSKLKDPRQIWYGIEPGTLVNLEDKAVYRSTIYSESEKHKTDIQIHLENWDDFEGFKYIFDHLIKADI